MEVTRTHADPHVTAQHISDNPKGVFTGKSRRLLNNTSIRTLDYLSISIGFIYIWFGALKFFPNVSPAEELATNTVVALTGGMLTAKVAILSLAIMEFAIGIGLILRSGRKFWLKLALFHMFCTFTPLFLFPALSFGDEPFQLTLVGQYIIKNVVIVGVLFHLLARK